MPVQVYVPGPVRISVGTGTSGALEMLGLSQQDVRPQIETHFRNVMTSLSGPVIPFDRQFMGKAAQVSFDLALYDEAILLKLMAATTAASAGTIEANSIGALMRLEQQSVRLLLQFPYASKAAFSGSMLPAMNFPCAHLVGSTSWEAGTENKVVHVTMDTIVLWTTADGTGILWNTTTTGAPTLS